MYLDKTQRLSGLPVLEMLRDQMRQEGLDPNEKLGSSAPLIPEVSSSATPVVDMEINRFLVENDKGIADTLDFFVKNLSSAIDWWGKVNAGLTPWLE